LLLVLRIRGIDDLSNEVKKVFRVLNLTSVNCLSLLRNDEKVLA
jgi:ribosomal protein L30/L7E